MGLAGRSLRSFLQNPSAVGRSAVFTVVTRGSKARGESVRTERWRYTNWSDGAEELYDHAHDEDETKNVVKANREVADRLRKMVHSVRGRQKLDSDTRGK